MKLTATVTAPDPSAGYTPTGNVTFVDFETGFRSGCPCRISGTSPYTGQHDGELAPRRH